MPCFVPASGGNLFESLLFVVLPVLFLAWPPAVKGRFNVYCRNCFIPSVGFVVAEPLFNVVYSRPLCVTLEFFVLFAGCEGIFFEVAFGLLGCAALYDSRPSSMS